jgi:hypothetical protein
VIMLSADKCSDLSLEPNTYLALQFSS